MQGFLQFREVSAAQKIEWAVVSTS
jgi:hypothetical protein